jgi:hypothetical protein
LIEALVEFVAAKSIPFHSINQPFFREMIQCTHADFSVPVYDMLRPHIKQLAGVHQQFPEHQEKIYCSLLVDGARKFDRRFLAVTMFMEGYVRFADLKGLMMSERPRLPTVSLRMPQLQCPIIIS